MTPKPLDFEAARADLRGKIATNDAELTKTRDRLGALALDVTLGNAAQSELDAANAEQARLQINGEALQSALAEVDKREAAHVAAEAEKQRQADEKRLAELQCTCNAAGATVVEMAQKLADVLAEGREASREAEALGRKLDVSTVVIARWSFTARQILMARSGMQGGFMRPGEREAAELSLTGRQ